MFCTASYKTESSCFGGYMFCHYQVHSNTPKVAQSPDRLCLLLQIK